MKNLEKDLFTGEIKVAFRFVAFADSSGGSQTPSFSVLRSESVIISNLNPIPKFICYPGDLCGDSSTFGNCITNYWKPALNAGGNLWDKTFVGRGNHDCSSDNLCNSTDNTTWQSIFNFGPETDANSIANKVNATNYSYMTGYNQLNYSFDYENSHFVFLDEYNNNISHMTTAQINWLDADLTSAEQRTNLQHAFLMWHFPIYDNGSGHCESCCGIWQCTQASASLINVLNRHPIISASFHGHEHNITYAHITSAEISGLTREFEHFISGAAGAGLYGINSGRRVDYYLGSSLSNTYFGLLVIDVNGINYTVTSYREDTGTIDCKWDGSNCNKTFTNNYNPIGCVNPTCTFQLE